MAGFRKATAKQAALKIGFYGPPGSGKTFTALLVAEGLARHTGKRIAYVDTEQGTDFYSKSVPTRQHHPDAFDFDALYTRSLTEVLKEVKELDPKKYGVIVIDSITHLWEAARAAYSGKQTSIGTIPIYAWGTIKKPYKELITFLLNSPMHLLICGRQGQEYTTDEDTGELKNIGVKLKAEGETPYEPHILIRMEAIRQGQGKARGQGVPTAYAEKDRTGVLAGKVIPWPNFETLAAPVLDLLGGEQAQIPDEDATAAQDADALLNAEQKKAKRSHNLLRQYRAQFEMAETAAQVEKVSKLVTPAVKKEMLAADLELLRSAWVEASNRFEAEVANQREPGIDVEDDPPPEELKAESQWHKAVEYERAQTKEAADKAVATRRKSAS
jgi:hypothetical protein